MDAFSLLKADHRKVEKLFERLEAANGKAKLPVFEQIKTELELHTHIEEKILYPALEKPKQTHELTLEAYEEHDVVKKLLKELSSSKTADEQWQAQAMVLKENVEHHVEEEENELFPKADAALSEEDIEALGERLEAEKERQQGRAAGSSAKKASGKKSAASTKSASKTKAASKAAKRIGGSKKAAKSSSRSGSKTSAKSSKKSAKKGRR